jgi:hypothetical protein
MCLMLAAGNTRRASGPSVSAELFEALLHLPPGLVKQVRVAEAI